MGLGNKGLSVGGWGGEVGAGGWGRGGGAGGGGGGECLGRRVGSHSRLLILTIPLTLSHFSKENLSCSLFIATPSFFQDQKL